MSKDWFKGKSYPETIDVVPTKYGGFHANFPLNQSIENDFGKR
jgi:hypothetical protein